MKMTYATVLEAALALGKSDRRKLQRQVALTLDPPPNPEVNGTPDDESHHMRPDMTDEEFDTELRRRIEEAERDPSVLVSWEDAEKELRKLCR